MMDYIKNAASFLGIWGMQRVNVLQLNIALDLKLE
jgi:K+-transporting ATPase c subunit